MEIDYIQRNYPGNNQEWLGPCNCCGATVRRDLSKREQKGIRISLKKLGKEYDNGKNYRTHVKTKQGTLTVDIKYA